MKCRKAFELDLADFVGNPRSSRWASFRAHYPGCADCAAEVRIWDELQAFLRSGGPGATMAHPPKELLLRYEEQRSSLSAIEAALLQQHLATCRACPDELAALRSFAFPVVGHHPSPRPRSRRTLGLDVLSRLRPVVLHPAFAYALVLMLLYPALIRPRLAGRSLPDEQLAERIPGEPPDGGSAPREPSPLRQDDPAAPAVASGATPPTDLDSQLAAGKPRPRLAPSRRAPPARSAARDGAPPHHEADNAPATKEPAVAAADADASDETEEADESDARVLGLAETEEPHDDVRHARRAAEDTGATPQDAASEASWQTIVLAPGRTPEVQRAALATGIVLRLPPADRDVEIRVVGPGGREAAREMVRSSSKEPIAVRIRASELATGTYHVLTPTSELLFIVR